MKIKDYLKNKYVVIGLIGVAFYLYKRRQLVKANPIVEKSVEELDDKSNFSEPKDDVKVSSSFIDDVAKMDNKTLKRTMETNKKILKRAKMSDKKKQVVKDMLAYMKKEYDSRTRNK
jgi:tRNA C32,U32 (ribose-2'-O)-methylase TrmJ